MATEKAQEFSDGQLVAEVDVEVPDAVVNQRSIVDAARTALAANRAFIALGSPSNAQVVAQVKALTRQVNGLIRLELNELDGTN